MSSLKATILMLFICFGDSQEIQYQDIPLSGLITNPKQEISGLDWYQDQLVLLPENLGGFLYMIPKEQLIQSLEDKTPIEPKQPSLFSPDYSKFINGFEGLEAIAFHGNEVNISLEANVHKTISEYVAVSFAIFTILTMHPVKRPGVAVELQKQLKKRKKYTKK